jgi:hypothetical protein
MNLFKPINIEEIDLVREIVSGKWRQERWWNIEAAMLDLSSQDAEPAIAEKLLGNHPGIENRLRTTGKTRNPPGHRIGQPLRKPNAPPPRTSPPRPRPPAISQNPKTSNGDQNQQTATYPRNGRTPANLIPLIHIRRRTSPPRRRKKQTNHRPRFA